MKTQFELFKMFCGNEDDRPVSKLPFEINGKVCATDFNTLIRCDKSFIDFDLDNPHKSLNVDKIIPTVTCNRIVSNQLEDFDVFKKENEFAKKGEDVECSECEGFGEVEWECGHHTKTDDCPVCHGSGYSSCAPIIPTGKKTFKKYDYLTMDGVFFNINVFIKLFEAQKVIGEEIISLNICQELEPAYFKIGNYEFLFMPIRKGTGNESLVDISFK